MVGAAFRARALGEPVVVARPADPRALKRSAMSESANLLLLAAAWGFGAMLTSTGAKAELSQVLILSLRSQPEVAELLDDEGLLAPPGLQLHDHYFDAEAGGWRSWEDKLAASVEKALEQDTPKGLAEDQEYTSSRRGEPSAHRLQASESLLVATSETLRYRFLLDRLIRGSVPVCLAGATGSGKSSLIKEFLSVGLPADEWEHGSLVLSATTRAAFLQSYVESRLEKQRRGIYGPSVQGKRLLLFLDDFSMPARERYGA